MIRLKTASAMPSTLTSGCSPPTSARIDSTATYGARMKNWIATSFCARCSAVWDITREPVKRQMMITLAKPSIAESRPKPTSAIEPAMTPAAIATIPSTLITPSDSHDSSFTRAASSR